MKCSFCKRDFQVKPRVYKNVKEYLERQPRFGESLFRKMRRELGEYLQWLWQEVVCQKEASGVSVNLKPETLVRVRHLESSW